MRVVVDTDILRAANGDSSNAFAILCAKILDNILNGGHVLVVCDQILKEWFSPPSDDPKRSTRLSKWSHWWYHKMRTTKKIYKLSASSVDSLCDTLKTCFDGESITSKIHKDCPFMSAAILTDKIIFSNNTTERGHLKSLCEKPQCAELVANLKWLHPSTGALNWLNGKVPVTAFIIC